jgi:hypothetical protein
MAGTEAMRSRVSISTLLSRYPRLILAFPETDIDLMRLIVKHAVATTGKVFVQRAVTSADLLKLVRADAMPGVSEIYTVSLPRLRAANVAVIGRVLGGPILEIIPGRGSEHQIRVFYMPDISVKPETLVLPETVSDAGAPLEEGRVVSGGLASAPSVPKPAALMHGQDVRRTSESNGAFDLSAELLQALEEPGVIVASTPTLRTLLAVLRSQVGAA